MPMNSNFGSSSSNIRTIATSSSSIAVPGRSSNISECPQRPPARHMQPVTSPSSDSLKSALKLRAASPSSGSNNNSINPAAVAAATVAALPVSKAFLSPSASKKKPVSLGGGGPVFSTLQLEFDCRSTSNHNSVLSAGKDNSHTSSQNKTMNQQRDYKPTVAANTEKSLSTSSRNIVMRMNDESAFSESSTLEGSDYLTLASLCISDKTNSSTVGANAVGAVAMDVRQRARLSAQQQNFNSPTSGSDTGSSRLTSVSELTPNSQALPGVRGRNSHTNIRRTNSSCTGRFSANTLSSGSWGGGGGTPSTKSSTSLKLTGDAPPSRPPRQRNRPKHSKSMPSAGFAAFPLEDLKEDLDDDDDEDSTSSCIELGGSSSNIDGSSGSDDKSIMSISAKKLLERKHRKATSSLLRRKSHRDLLDETDDELLPGSPQLSPAAPPAMPVRRPPSPASAEMTAVPATQKAKTSLSSNPPTKPVRSGLSPVHSNTQIKTIATNADVTTTIPTAAATAAVDRSESSHHSKDNSLAYEDGHSLHLHHYDGQSVVSALTYDDESTVTSSTPSTPGSFWKNKTQEQSTYAQYHNSRPPQRSTSGRNGDNRTGPNKALHHVSKEDVQKAMLQNMHMSLPSHSHFMSLPLREEDEHETTSQSDGDVSLSAKKLVAKQQQRQQQQPVLAANQYPQYKDALPPFTRNVPPGAATNDNVGSFGRRNMMQKAKSVSHINNNSSTLEHRLMALPARTKSSGKDVLNLQQQELLQQQEVGLLTSKNPPQMPIRSGASIIDDATLTSEILRKRQASGRLPEDRTRSLSPASRSSRWNTGAAGDASEHSKKDKTRMMASGNAAADCGRQLKDDITANNDKQPLFHRAVSNPPSTIPTKTINPPTTRGFGLPPRNGLQLRPTMGLSRSMSTPNLVTSEEEAATAAATGDSVSGSHALPTEKIESIVSFLLGKGIKSPENLSTEAKAGATTKNGGEEVSKLSAEHMVTKASNDLSNKQMIDDSLRLTDLASQGDPATASGPTSKPSKPLAAPSQGSGDLIRGWNNEEPGTASEPQPTTEEPETERLPVFQEWEAEQASKGIMGTLKKQIKTVGKASKYLRKKANAFAVTDKDEFANLSTSMSAFEYRSNTAGTGAFHMERLENLPDEEVSEEFGVNKEKPEAAVETKKKMKSVDEDKSVSASATKVSNAKQKKGSTAPKTRTLGKTFQFMRAASVPNLSSSQRGSSSKKGSLSEDTIVEESSLISEKELKDRESGAEKSKAKPISPSVSPKQTLSPVPVSGSGRTHTKRRTRNMKTPSIRNLDATESVPSRTTPKLQANSKDSVPIKFDVDPSTEKTKTTPVSEKVRMSSKLQSNLKDSAPVKFDGDTSSSAEKIKSSAATDKPLAAEKSRRRSGRDKLVKSSKRDKKNGRSKSASARPRRDKEKRDKEKKDKARTKMSASVKTASVRRPNFDSSMSSMSISGKKHNESLTSRADETVFSLASNLKEESRKARREGRPSYRKHMSLRNVDDSASRTTASTNSVTVSTAQSIRKLPNADPLSPNEVHSQRNFGPTTPSASRRTSRARLTRGMAQSERHLGRTKSDMPPRLLGSSGESSEDDEGNKFPPLAYSKRRSMSQSRQRSRRSLQSGSRKQMSSRTLNISDESTAGSGDGIVKVHSKLKSSLKTQKVATTPKTSRGIRTDMKKAQSLRNLGY